MDSSNGSSSSSSPNGNQSAIVKPNKQKAEKQVAIFMDFKQEEAITDELERTLDSMKDLSNPEPTEATLNQLNTLSSISYEASRFMLIHLIFAASIASTDAGALRALNILDGMVKRIDFFMGQALNSEDVLKHLIEVAAPDPNQGIFASRAVCTRVMQLMQTWTDLYQHDFPLIGVFNWQLQLRLKFTKHINVVNGSFKKMVTDFQNDFVILHEAIDFIEHEVNRILPKDPTLLSVRNRKSLQLFAKNIERVKGKSMALKSQLEQFDTERIIYVRNLAKCIENEVITREAVYTFRAMTSEISLRILRNFSDLLEHIIEMFETVQQSVVDIIGDIPHNPNQQLPTSSGNDAHYERARVNDHVVINMEHNHPIPVEQPAEIIPQRPLRIFRPLPLITHYSRGEASTSTRVYYHAPHSVHFDRSPEIQQNVAPNEYNAILICALFYIIIVATMFSFGSDSRFFMIGFDY